MMTLYINNPELEKQLKKFSAETDQPIELLVTKLIELSLLQQERRYELERLDDEESIKQAINSGRYIKNDKVKEWLNTWGTQ